MLDIEVVRDESQCLILLFGSLDEKAWDAWTECLRTSAEIPDVTSYVFGFHTLRYISSRAVGALLRFVQTQQRRGRSCHIASPQAQIHEALEDMGFYSLTGLNRERKELFGISSREHFL